MPSTDRPRPTEPSQLPLRWGLLVAFAVSAAPNVALTLTLLLGWGPWTGDGLLLSAMGVIGAILLGGAGGLLLLPMRSTRATGLAWVLLCGAVACGLLSSYVLRHATRAPAFHLAGRRAQPIVEAMERYVAEHGAPPAEVADLIPEYLPELPARVPPLEVEAGGPDVAWRLTADASLGLLNWDVFYYEAGAGAGGWTYFHE